MTLLEFVSQYIQSRRICTEYAKNLGKRAAALARRTGCAELAHVLTESIVNDFLRSLDLSPYTVRSYRSDILSLWNAAADLDLVPYPIARRLFRCDVPELLIDCYTLEETRALVESCKNLNGCYRNGVTRMDYWSAAIPLAWDAGLRRGDVWQFQRDHLRPDRTFRVVQHKTKRAVTLRLHESTVTALDRIARKQPCLWPIDASFFGRHFQRIVKSSGVNRGSFKWLRRASGSYVEMQQPGAGHKHLGHANGIIFDKHYDAKLGGHTLPQPPEL